MESLIRTRVSGFELEDSLKLSEIERLKAEGTLDEHIVPIDAVFEEYPAVSTKPEFDRLVHNGNPCYLNQIAGNRKMEDGLFRVYDSAGQFIGVYEVDGESRMLKPRKVFLGGN